MLRLAWPVVLAQVGIMLMGVVDTAMVGRVGTSAVAAVALGHIYWVNVTIFGMGILLVLDPVVSQATGAKDHEGVARGVQRGVLMALALSVPTALLLIPGELFFGFLRQPADVTPIAATFSRISIAGVVPFYLFFALRQSLQAMAQTKPVVIAIVVSNFVELRARLRADLRTLRISRARHPGLGDRDGAEPVADVRPAAVLRVAAAARRHRAVAAGIVPASAPMLRMLRIGVPVAFQNWIEIAVFSGGAVALGWFGAVPLAAHEIAINLAALTFMFPMGVSRGGRGDGRPRDRPAGSLRRAPGRRRGPRRRDVVHGDRRDRFSSRSRARSR